MPKVDCSELSQTIMDLIVNISADPDVKNLDDAVAVLKTIAPQMTREVVRDAIIEATEGNKKQVDAIQKTLTAIKRESREDKKLEGEIDDFMSYSETGTVPPKKARVTLRAPDAIQRLRKTRDNIKKWVANSDPVMALKLSKRLDVLNKQIQRGDLAMKPEHAGKLHAEIAKIQKLIDNAKGKVKSEKTREKLLKQINSLQKNLEENTLPETVPRKGSAATEGIQRLRSIIGHLKKKVSKSEAAQAKRLKAQVAELERRVKEGDILPKTKPVESPKSKRVERLQFKKDKLNFEIRHRMQMAKPKTIGDWVAEPFQFARTMMTAFDLSAVRRQGGFIFTANPRVSMGAFRAMFKALASEKGMHKIQQDIDNHPLRALASIAGLYQAPLDGTYTLTEMEEAFQSKLAEKIPGVRASERAYVMFLNKQRFDIFVAMSQTMGKSGEVTYQEAKDIANFVNIATGRGGLGKFKSIALPLSVAFFAPRYAVSRFQLLLGSPIWQAKSKRSRNLVIQEYVRYLVGMSLYYGVFAMLAGIMDWAIDFEWNPRSSDFGKIRIGNTRIDPLSGISQATVLLSRVLTGKTKSSTTGIVTALRGKDKPYGSGGTLGVMGRFLRFKLSPMFGTGVSALAGEDPIGEPFGVQDVTTDLVVPLAMRDIYEAMVDQGVPTGTALGILSIFGEGLMVYGDHPSTMTKSELMAEIKDNTYKADQKKHPAGVYQWKAKKGKDEYVRRLRTLRKNR